MNKLEMWILKFSQKRWAKKMIDSKLKNASEQDFKDFRIKIDNILKQIEEINTNK